MEICLRNDVMIAKSRYSPRAHAFMFGNWRTQSFQLRRLVKFNENLSRLELVDDTFHYSEQM